MLKISKEFDYAVQLITALASLKEKDELLSLKKFSQESNISFLFLQRIARSLKQAGLIDSVRGVKGGYKMKKEATKITLKDILTATEGKVPSISKCIADKNLCKKSAKCNARILFSKINKELLTYLEKTPIIG